MTLYEIDKMILGCIKVSDSEYVDTETGEVIDIDYLNHLEMERDEKISNIIKFYLNLKSESESLEAEGKKFMARAKAAKNKAEQLKSYLSFIQNGEKYKTTDGLHNISFRRTKSVEVTDMSKLPKAYLRFKDPEPNKEMIKEALNSAVDVPGAVIVEKLSAQIK